MPFNQTWNTTYENAPADTDLRSEGAARIRNVKVALRERLAVEHTFETGTPTDQGFHKAGSAKAYYAATASAPTLRPDLATALTTADHGRLWFDTTLETLKVYHGSTWHAVNVATADIADRCSADTALVGLTKSTTGTLAVTVLVPISVVMDLSGSSSSGTLTLAGAVVKQLLHDSETSISSAALMLNPGVYSLVATGGATLTLTAKGAYSAVTGASDIWT